MILDLDAGNSSIKWRIRSVSSGGTIKSGRAASSSELQDAIVDRKQPIEEICLCSVRSEDYTRELVDWGQRSLGVSARVARVVREKAGLTVQYEDLSRLGIDRWLAMLAAYQASKAACIVVDGGTALTVDVIGADGVHQGGYIVPGLAIMRRSIEANTSIRLDLKSPSEREESPLLAHNTLDAVCNGSFAALSSLILRVHAEQRTKAGQCQIFLAGGDAKALQPELRDQGVRSIHSAPELVLDGLAIALAR